MLDRIITVNGDDILYNGQKVGELLISAPVALRSRFVAAVEEMVVDYHAQRCPQTVDLLDEDEDED